MIEKRVEVAVARTERMPQVDIKAVVAEALAVQNKKTQALLAAAEARSTGWKRVRSPCALAITLPQHR